MSENITSKTTPLRNTKGANKPFRSPLTQLSTPKNNESPRNVIASPLSKSATPKRSDSQFRPPIKRRRIENLKDDVAPGDVIVKSDLVALKRRVRNKRQDLEVIKTKLKYLNKHKPEDLQPLISMWRTGCKEALYKFLEDARIQTAENLSMKQLLTNLGIPQELVKFTEDECDLT